MWAAIGICPLAASRRCPLTAMSSRRVLAAGDTTALPVPPSRVRVVDSTGAPLQGVDVVGPHGAVDTQLAAGPAGRSVVFAEAPEWADVAQVTFDGTPLQRLSATGPPTYELPATAGRLGADLPPARQRWFLAQLALLALVVFLAVPFGSRRSRRLT